MLLVDMSTIWIVFVGLFIVTNPLLAWQIAKGLLFLGCIIALLFVLFNLNDFSAWAAILIAFVCMALLSMLYPELFN